MGCYLDDHRKSLSNHTEQAAYRHSEYHQPLNCLYHVILAGAATLPAGKSRIANAAAVFPFFLSMRAGIELRSRTRRFVVKARDGDRRTLRRAW